MAKPTTPRDRLLDNPHVIAYRDICQVTPNAEQRKLIVATVTDSARWQRVLRKFMAEGQPPRRVDWTLERYRQGNDVARPLTGAQLEELMNSERKHDSRAAK